MQVHGFQLQDVLHWLQRDTECIRVQFGVCYPLSFPNHLTRSQRTVREQIFMLLNEQKVCLLWRFTQDLRHTDRRGHLSPNRICSENSDRY